MKYHKVIAGVLIAAFVLATQTVEGHGFSTRAIQAFSRAITPAGYFGAPRYATAALPTCGANNVGALAYDTTTTSLKVCITSTWTATGAATLAGNTFTGTQVAPQFTANTGQQGFYLGGTAVGGLIYGTSQTPDTFVVSTGTLGNSVVMVENGDIATDFAHALQTHPTLFVHSANASPVTQYLGLSAHGLQTELFKTLTEAAATSIVRIPVAAEAGVGGMLVYTVYATDGSTPQTRHGRIIFTATNDGGTETCVIGTAEELDNTPTGTLTATVTCDTAQANAIELQLNATSSLTQTTLQAYYTVIITGPGSPLLQ